MRVVATSDFHGHIPPDVPSCDLLIVAGDCIGGSGALGGNSDSLDAWLARQPAETIVGIAGNHDFLAWDNPDAARELSWLYLQDEGCVVDGVKVWGSPWSVPFFQWAFMAPEDELAAKWALIPDDTEILVVHGPAHGINDSVSRGHVGSITLRERLDELPNLRLLVTGHIHEAYGDANVAFPHNGVPRYVRCVNASLLDGGYRQCNLPVIIDL